MPDKPSDTAPFVPVATTEGTVYVQPQAVICVRSDGPGCCIYTRECTDMVHSTESISSIIAKLAAAFPALAAVALTVLTLNLEASVERLCCQT